MRTIRIRQRVPITRAKERLRWDRSIRVQGVGPERSRHPYQEPRLLGLANAAHLDSVIFKPYPDQTAEMNALQAGDIDLAVLIAPPWSHGEGRFQRCRSSIVVRPATAARSRSTSPIHRWTTRTFASRSPTRSTSRAMWKRSTAASLRLPITGCHSVWRMRSRWGCRPTIPTRLRSTSPDRAYRGPTDLGFLLPE